MYFVFTPVHTHFNESDCQTTTEQHFFGRTKKIPAEGRILQRIWYYTELTNQLPWTRGLGIQLWRILSELSLNKGQVRTVMRTGRQPKTQVGRSETENMRAVLGHCMYHFLYMCRTHQHDARPSGLNFVLYSWHTLCLLAVFRRQKLTPMMFQISYDCILSLLWKHFFAHHSFHYVLKNHLMLYLGNWA